MLAKHKLVFTSCWSKCWEVNFQLSRQQKMPRNEWVMASTVVPAFQLKKAEKH